MNRLGKALTMAAAAACVFGPRGAPRAETPARVGISMPNSQQERWQRDGADLAARLRLKGYGVELYNAGGDVSLQMAQIRGMIEAGDRALVVAPVSTSALGDVLADAAARHIVVIAYDRLIRRTTAVNYFVSFDNSEVGTEQARSLLEGLGYPKRRGPFTIEVFAGSPEDGNSYSFYAGSMKVLRPLIASGALVVASGETDMQDVTTAHWSADAAHARLDNLLAAYYQGRRLDGVLAPNDGIAAGVTASLADAGYGRRGVPMPIVTGQDCEIGAVRAIARGAQYSSVFKDTRALADAASGILTLLLAGRAPQASDTTFVDNGAWAVPTRLLPPVTVNRGNLRRVLIDSGYYTADALR